MKNAFKNQYFLYISFILIIFLKGCSYFQEIIKPEIHPGFNKLLDSVVRIDVWEASFSSGARTIHRAVGSGVIMTKDGYVLTNAHVVSPYEERIIITLNNLEQVPAKFIGWDHWTDIAVLKIDLEVIKQKKINFNYASFANSNKLKPGTVVYAVGTPHGLSRTVTRGIISNNNRYLQAGNNALGYEHGCFSNWLQTDASINPGNSGGPLVISNGFVIGLNSMAYIDAENLGFAIPSNFVNDVMTALIKDKKIKRSYIGITAGPLQELEDFYSLHFNTGMLVQSIDPGSPASTQNLRPGDIILEIDGKSIDGRFPEQLPTIYNIIASYPVGVKIPFKVKRGENIKIIQIKTEALESRIGEEYAFKSWGLGVQKVTRSIAREKKLDSNNGVIVTGTQLGFPAGKSNLYHGDIIVKINNQIITSIDIIKDCYFSYKNNPEQILFEVLRGHQIYYVVMKP